MLLLNLFLRGCLCLSVPKHFAAGLRGGEHMGSDILITVLIYNSVSTRYSEKAKHYDMLQYMYRKLYIVYEKFVK